MPIPHQHQTKQKRKIIAIVGPTSSGKTALGIKLAKNIPGSKKLRGEIISADSRQVYRGLDIGTGKVTKSEMAGVPHHLLSIISPKRSFSAGEFAKQGKKEIGRIIKRGNIPIVVGGTGFYADALLGQVMLPEVPPNPALRQKLSKKSAAELFAMLKKMDPRRAGTIDAQNPVRLIRAIEIAHALGQVPLFNTTQPSAIHSKVLKNIGMNNVLWIGIEVPQKKLEQKICARLLARMRQGMIAEARRLHRDGLSYKRMEELGLEYRYLAWHLQGKITKEELIEQLSAAIRNYAKRQLRYLRRNKSIIWIKNEKEAMAHINKFMK